VLEGQGRLDESGDSRSRVQMADVALDRPDRAELDVARAGCKRLGQSGHFNRVSQRCGRAVAFDVGDGAGIDAGRRQRHLNGPGLACDAGRGEADFRGAVVGDAAAADHGINVIALAQRIFEPLEQHHARAAAEYRAGGVGIEGPARPVGGHHAAVQILVAALLGKVIDTPPASAMSVS